MRTSDQGVEFIMTQEGLRLFPYRDAGNYAIGYGHTIRANESYLLNPSGISPTTARNLLVNDILEAENAVLNSIRVPITQNQLDALVSLQFNAGLFPVSDLANLINSTASPSQIYSWWVSHYTTSQGVPNATLARRRALEATAYTAEPAYNITNLPAIIGPQNLPAGRDYSGALALALFSLVSLRALYKLR